MHAFTNYALNRALTIAFASTLVACGSPPDTQPKAAPPPASHTPTPNNPTKPGETPPTPDTTIVLQNLDGHPFNDRLVFSRIQQPQWNDKRTPDPDDQVTLQSHDRATLRIKNTSSKPVLLSSATFSHSAWRLTDSTLIPTSIPAGSALDLPVQFIGTGNDRQASECALDARQRPLKCIFNGTLTLSTDDPDELQKRVELASFWQLQPEADEREPTLQQILDLFGYTTVLTKAGENLNDNYSGTVKAVGDEVVSAYWQRVDTKKPVYVRQLAAFHGAPQDEYLWWFNKGEHDQMSTNRNRVIAQDALDSQTVLPRNYQLKSPAEATFTPNGDVFGFRVDYEWSDPSLNIGDAKNNTHGKRNNCLGDGGHNVRFWPLKNREGQVVASSYLMAMDAFCINYDYNDNVYLVTNIQPSGQE